MKSTIGPHALDASPYILTPSGAGVVKPFSPGFFGELDTEFAEFAGHSLVMINAFDEPWSTWEIHPKGDEFVLLLEGDTDFIFRVDGKDVTVRVCDPGTYVVVPKNTWHTARPHAPTRMLFVTPGEGTRNSDFPD